MRTLLFLFLCATLVRALPIQRTGADFLRGLGLGVPDEDQIEEQQSEQPPDQPSLEEVQVGSFRRRRDASKSKFSHVSPATNQCTPEGKDPNAHYDPNNPSALLQMDLKSFRRRRTPKHIQSFQNKNFVPCCDGLVQRTEPRSEDDPAYATYKTIEVCRSKDSATITPIVGFGRGKNYVNSARDTNPMYYCLIDADWRIVGQYVEDVQDKDGKVSADFQRNGVPRYLRCSNHLDTIHRAPGGPLSATEWRITFANTDFYKISSSADLPPKNGWRGNRYSSVSRQKWWPTLVPGQCEGYVGCEKSTTSNGPTPMPTPDAASPAPTPGGVCKDDDKCLQAKPSWGSSYTCAGSTQFCTGKYTQDMTECCPQSCDACPDTAAPTTVQSSTPEPTETAPEPTATPEPTEATLDPTEATPEPTEATPAPETPAPATPAPETPAPATPAPETPVSTATPEPTAAPTAEPKTPAPETAAPETPAPATPAPTATPEPTAVPTAEPKTPAPETPAPATPAPETPAPETPAPETPAPATPAPTATPEPTAVPTTEPKTPAPETPAPATPAPETPAPATPAPATPAPATPVPTAGCVRNMVWGDVAGACAAELARINDDMTLWCTHRCYTLLNDFQRACDTTGQLVPVKQFAASILAKCSNTWSPAKRSPPNVAA